MTPAATPDVVHCREDEYDVYIGRGGNGDLDFASWIHGEIDTGEDGWLGNPFPEAEYGQATCIEMFRMLFAKVLADGPRRNELRDELRSLSGARLGCFCAPEACHGDVIAAAIEAL